MNKWQSLGLVIEPTSHIKWAHSHASLPVPVKINETLIRVYYSSRNVQNHSYVGFSDLELSSGKWKVKYTSPKPILKPGNLGEFDDHGIYASSVVQSGQKELMYTIGWSPGQVPPLFYANIGLAHKSASNEFKKLQNFPILSRSAFDPCLVTSPVVIKEDSLWRMWYVSGEKWQYINGVPQSFYNIKYAYSKDGIEWKREGKICINYSDNESNISRFWVTRMGEKYVAYYSSAAPKGHYSIKYATSSNGTEWKKCGSISFLGEPQEWCNQAQAYPATIHIQGDYYMLYNGNGYGKAGIGIARLIK